MPRSECDLAAQTDILIVGAGPTGLTLACELARRGIDHLIIDRLESPNMASRGKGIQPRSLEVLDDLGVVDVMLAIGATKLPLRLYDQNGDWTDRAPVTTPATIATPFPDLLWIAEFDVENALRDRMAQYGQEVMFGTVAQGLVDNGDSVDIEICRPGGSCVTIRARWVVAADGGGSTVRKALGIPFEGTTNPASYYLGDVRTLDLDRGRQHVWASKMGMLAMTPLPSTDLWQFQCGIPGAVVNPEEPSLALYQQMIDDRAAIGHVRLTDASWLSLYRANVRLAQRYRIGSVFLAGDAAHAHPPAGGQGMNTGIQDAYNLAWKLAAVIGGAHPDLLDTYEAERRSVAKAMIEDTNARSAKVREGVQGNAGEVASAIHGITDDWTTGLQITYANGQIGRDAFGSRAPYVTGLHGPGFAGTTFDLFRGPHWTALAFSDDAKFDLDQFGQNDLHVYRIGRGAIVDQHDEMRKTFGVAGERLVLVRPDGYIALNADLHSQSELQARLAKLFPTSEYGCR